MSDLAIDICDLSKEYRIGSKQQGYTTLRDMLADSLTAPLRRTVKILRGDALSAAGASEMVWALKDISFSVRHGEVLGLIGRNGAGKSTLLKILSRITEPTSGYADVEGRVGSLLEVGTGFHPELTGRENIYLNGAILGMHRTEIAGKLDEIIAFAEIERYIDTPVKHYSTGMYMRLAFAVAAHLEPDILIVDEVLAVGDASFQKKCLGKMGDVAREGRTILFVSHNMAAIQALCTHGVLLSGGKVEAVGSIGEVIYKYQAALSSVSSLEGIRGVQVLTVRLSTEPQGQLITPDSTVVAEMEFYTERSLPNSYLNLHVDDEEGRHLIHTRTDMFGERPDFQPGLHHVRVRIPRLTLRAGIYSVWFRLYNDSGDATELADSERVMLEVRGPQVGGLIDVPTEWYWTEAEAPVAH